MGTLRLQVRYINIGLLVSYLLRSTKGLTNNAEDVSLVSSSLSVAVKLPSVYTVDLNISFERSSC